MARVSVIVPIYNCERYLLEAIRSVLEQTFNDFTLLLLDDGSMDRSLEIAQKAADLDSRVMVLGGEHRGYVHWLNAGLGIAKSEFIARMDADDVCLVERFARQVRFLDSHPECCAVGTQAVRIDPDGLPINCWNVPEDHEQIDQQHMDGRPGGLIHPSVMMRRSALTQVGGYRTEFEPGEDYDLFLRLAEVGRLSNLPEILLQYRMHERCVTFTRAEAQAQSVRRATNEAWRRRGRTESPPTAPGIHLPSSTDEFAWNWAVSAFAARNFKTARKHAFRLLCRRPSDWRRWILFWAACFGPLASLLKRVCSYRIGPYQPLPAKS